MAKIIILILFLFLLMPMISAEEFSIEIRPHWYVKGHEVVWTPDIEVSAISFEIIGKNFNQRYRILNMSIVDAFPQEFKKALPLGIQKDLRILQTKTLFISQLIDINDLKQFNQTNISLFVGVEGIHESSNELIYSEGFFTLELQEPPIKKQGILQRWGEAIWENNPTAGILVILIVIFMVGFFYWKGKGSEKLNKWREESERKKAERKKFEEGWK